MEDAMQLWEAVEKRMLMPLNSCASTADNYHLDDFSLFSPVNQKMIRPRDVEIKHIPLKIYIPAAASDDDETTTTPGHLRVIQGLIAPQVSASTWPIVRMLPMIIADSVQGQPQTLGTALNSLVPSLFPSRRMPILAYPILHGAIVPLGISLDALSELGSYADGYLHMTVMMIR
jgi:autophagy-related protein 5